MVWPGCGGCGSELLLAGKILKTGRVAADSFSTHFQSSLIKAPSPGLAYTSSMELNTLAMIDIQQALHARLHGDLLLHRRNEAGERNTNRIKIRTEQAEAEQTALVGQHPAQQLFGAVEQENRGAHLRHAAGVPNHACDSSRMGHVAGRERHRR